MLVACLLVSSCAWLMPPPQVRGNKVDPELLKELTPGTSTKADVSAIIGSPTARDTFDDNTWLYISELTQERIGRTLGELKQNVVVLNFDEKGVLTNVHKLDQDNALPVTRDRPHHPVAGNRGIVHAATARQYWPLQPGRRRTSVGASGGGPAPAARGPPGRVVPCHRTRSSGRVAAILGRR